MAMDLFRRLNIEVAATQESVQDNKYTSRSEAAKELLKAMSERRYSPNNDPAIKRFEDRLRGIVK
jgi:Arc/MetJ-type ribon-helix-helix transcriptional regulator